MPNKISKRTFFLSTIIIILGMTFVISQKGNTQNEEDWKTVQIANLERNQQVHQSYLTGLLSDYKSTSLRLEYYEATKNDTSSAWVPFPIDPNSVKAFSWFTDGVKWRLDLRRVYPQVGQDFKQAAFDGETYISYDEYARMGEISGEKTGGAAFNFASDNDLNSFSSDAIVGGGIVPYLEKDWMNANEFPTYEKTEPVNGISCEKYSYSALVQGANTKVDVWFSKEKSVVIKYIARGVNVKSGQGSITVYSASKLRESSGVNVPSHVKLEMYSVNNQKLTWRVTKVFTLSDLQINDRNAVSAFEHPVRVTARINDTLNNPGPLKPIGGDYSEEIIKVSLGVPPQLEFPQAEADGKAPEVEQAQKKLETKP